MTKLKTLVLAVALGASASANAAIDTFNGNSEFYFSAWDLAAEKGYTFDLNWDKAFTDFAGQDDGYKNPLDLADVGVDASLIGAGGIIYDSALTGFGSQFSSTSNVVWNLAAFDNVGRERLITTANNATGPLTQASTETVKFTVGVTSVYAVQNNAYVAEGTLGDLEIDTYALTTPADGASYAGNWGVLWNNSYKFQQTNGNTVNAMGDSTSLYYYAPLAATSTIGRTPDPDYNNALFTQLQSFAGDDIVVKTYEQNGEWRLQIAAVSGVVTPPPVPEPESYAMLLAGLGLMGVVSRRKNK